MQPNFAMMVGATIFGLGMLIGIFIGYLLRRHEELERSHNEMVELTAIYEPTKVSHG